MAFWFDRNPSDRSDRCRDREVDFRLVEMIEEVGDRVDGDGAEPSAVTMIRPPITGCSDVGAAAGLTGAPSGRKLRRLPAHRAFWFGWHAAYPDTRLVD